MKMFRTSWILVALAITFVMAPLSSQAQLDREPEMLTMIADGVIVRPASAVVSVVGAAAFVVTWPFSALSKSTDSAWQSMVVKPVRFTFRRPMGQFDRDF